MVTIHFLDEKEGHYLYKRVAKLLSNHKKSNRSTPVKIHFTDDLALTIDFDSRDPVCDMLKPTLLNFFAEHIIRTREDSWIIRILEHTYYFQDKEEQSQILPIVRCLLDGHGDDIPAVRELPRREDVIVEALEVLFDCDMVFSYESFLQFRLKSYRELLQTYIECAIDEFKLEQEYQEYIHQLRQYVKTRVSLFSIVYLKHEPDRFRVYNEHDYELKQEDINSLMLDEQKRFEDFAGPDVLKLLIEIAPSKIYLFTDETDATLHQAIQNIFQERVKFFPCSKFEDRQQKL
ncbi:sporulation protein YtxC [Pseudalkalibacillus sp. SCS-8]|uniref:sporulation protein YtxC n=1 Tax=Pseudalkalibacillus nanhaiensis TaxID=3115291 RepID=UPI0032DA6885